MISTILCTIKHLEQSTIERLLYFGGGLGNSVQYFTVHKDVTAMCGVISLTDER